MFRAALCGNPNVGKSTVFNALTGLKQHTGNWSGKTVETAYGFFSDGEEKWQLTDLPGTYSLLNGSPEEQLASENLLNEVYDAVIVVCDATHLERNLNLALQIAQFCSNTIFCINMMDELRFKKMTIDLHALQALVGLPVIGISAHKKEGLDKLKETLRRIRKAKTPPVDLLEYPSTVEKSIQVLTEQILSSSNREIDFSRAKFAAMKCLCRGKQITPQILSTFDKKAEKKLAQKVDECQRELCIAGYTREKIVQEFLATSYQKASELCKKVIAEKGEPSTHKKAVLLDRMLSNRLTGLPIMTMLFAFVLYLTIAGANIPSAYLSKAFSSLEPVFAATLQMVHLPYWLRDLLVSGIYRVTTWIISVMLPPMAIFFPLFTLLEDWGLLPRIAFNLDKCFQRCRACGKQALCMCMGLGCNAVGVTGCRIIQSQRERVIAILTNALIPCNGKFPMLIAFISMFFAGQPGQSSGVAGVLILLLLIFVCVLMTLFCSWILSHTVLKGLPSAFMMEIPPFRRPQAGRIIIRSILDRTLFVLGRAVWIALPAGALIWGLANITLDTQPLLQYLTNLLEPIGRFFGMDGVILLAFVLGVPANEIILPLIVMIYMGQDSLTEITNLETVHAMLIEKGWTMTTVLSTLTFALFHWPCSSTTITVYKETKCIRWTLLAFLLPTAAGLLLCLLIRLTGQFI